MPAKLIGEKPSSGLRSGLTEASHNADFTKTNSP
jgi:hypothetical protein